MQYIIKITDDYSEPRYVERLQGWAPPQLTPSASRAAVYDEAKARENLEKVKKAIAREKGGEMVTAELVEAKKPEPSDSVQSAPTPSAPAETHSPLYIKGLGEPRGQFVFGGVAVLNLYMTKDKEGKIIYAFTSPEGEICAYKYDGPAVMCAFCEEAEAYGIEKIRAYEERHNE